ncbi:MAG: hypothetical protein ACFFFG_14130 [Candidatus Thorarchaeota archaeon]
MSEDVKKPPRLNYVFYGLVCIFLSVILLLIASRSINPPEGIITLTEEPPVLTEDMTALQTLRLLGFIGVIISIAFFVCGGIFFAIGLRAQRAEFDTSLLEGMRAQWSKSRGFQIFLFLTLVWTGIWIFNTATAPKIGDITFPLYSIREAFLQRALPTTPIEDLPPNSSYHIQGITLDFFVLLLFWYMIFVRIRPGEQYLEGFVDFTMRRPLFFVIFWIAAFYHIVGHLPMEFYGIGLWGGGLEQDLLGTPFPYTSDTQKLYLEGWFAFDKFAHMATSVVISMALVGVVTRQIRKMGATSDQGTKFIFLTAGLVTIAIGVLWEFAELLIFFGELQLDIVTIEYFAKEFNGSMKDLVWNSNGAAVGIILSVLDQKLVDHNGLNDIRRRDDIEKEI